MKIFKDKQLESIKCNSCEKIFSLDKSNFLMNLKHNFTQGEHAGETWTSDLCSDCIERFFLSVMEKQTPVNLQRERAEAFKITSLNNPKYTVFKIYRDISLQTSEKFIQDGDKFFIDGKTFIVLEHSEQLQYVVDNLDYTVKKILDFFPIRFIGAIANLKDDFIKNNIENLKGVLNNQILYKIVSEAISIKGFPVFISPFPAEVDRKNWITFSEKSYVVYRIK